MPVSAAQLSQDILRGEGSALSADLITTDEAMSGGVASVADGGTIAHGLSVSPTKYGVTATVAGRFVAVTAVSATTLTIALKNSAAAAVTVAENVAWLASPL